jgi:putative peptide zinc metalloprotease protein
MTLEMTHEPDVTVDGVGVDGADLADGVELLGEYEGSGYREAPYLIRRRDGQVMQVSHLIYLIAAALGPGVTYARVAEQVSRQFGREVTAANVAYLVDQRLRPTGVLRGAGDDTGSFQRANPLLALRLRLPLVPERAHRHLTRACLPLFRSPVVAAVLAGLVALDAWIVLSARGRLAAGVSQLIYQPQLMLLITALTIAAGVVHETGHATAACYGGARPGAMGAGVYLVWPVFYTDVTDTYRLSRGGRLRTDLGGVYFNVLATLAAAAVYQATGFGPLLAFVVLLQIETLVQFLPFVRLDGYYVVSDLAGVPNLFAYLKPTVVKLVCRNDSPLRRASVAKLDELTRRARVMIALWVGLTVPVLLGNVVLLVVLFPRIAGAAVGSAGVQTEAIIGGSGLDPVARLNGLVGLLLLSLPLAGILYIALRLGGRLRTALRAWWRTRPALTAVATATAGLVVMLQVGIFWPDTFVAAFQSARKAHEIGQMTDSYAASDPDDVLPLSTIDPFDAAPPSQEATVDDPLAIGPGPKAGPADGAKPGAKTVDADGDGIADGTARDGDDDDGGHTTSGTTTPGSVVGAGSTTTAPGDPRSHGGPTDRSADDDLDPASSGRPRPPASAPPTTATPPGTGPTTSVVTLPPTTGRTPTPASAPGTTAPPTTAPAPSSGQGAALLQHLLEALFPSL